MELKQWHGFCLCPLGGACPPDAAPADAPFSPLVFLVRRDTLRSRCASRSSGSATSAARCCWR